MPGTMLRCLREDWVGVSVAAALVVGAAWLGAGAFSEWRRFPDRPLETDVAGALDAGAAASQWVSVAPGAGAATRRSTTPSSSSCPRASPMAGC